MLTFAFLPLRVTLCLGRGVLGFTLLLCRGSVSGLARGNLLLRLPVNEFACGEGGIALELVLAATSRRGDDSLVLLVVALSVVLTLLALLLGGPQLILAGAFVVFDGALRVRQRHFVHSRLALALLLT